MTIFEQYPQKKDRSLLLSTLKHLYNINHIHHTLKPYIFGEVTTEGYFNVKRFDASFDNIFTRN